MRAISLYSGAGGMDVGFASAGIHTTDACELNSDAAATFSANFPAVRMHLGRVSDAIAALPDSTDIVFGGPPCQGYSIAGKMDPSDPRSGEVFTFLSAVERVRPAVFVMENVDSLAILDKWRGTMADIRGRAAALGYATAPVVLSAADYGAPQARRRLFLFGVHGDVELSPVVDAELSRWRRPGGTVREVLKQLGPAGTEANPHTCTARITYAVRPVLRRSPYAGMLFNGAGRPLRLDAPAPTMAASTGGNKTHFVDEDEMWSRLPSFVEGYHAHLMAGGAAWADSVPSRLRRLTLREAAAIQTFPEAHRFIGAKSACYRQIGNAVPCLLAEAAGRVAMALCPNR